MIWINRAGAWSIWLVHITFKLWVIIIFMNDRIWISINYVPGFACLFFSLTCVYFSITISYRRFYSEMQSQSIIPPSGKGFEKQVPTWLCVFSKMRHRADARWKWVELALHLKRKKKRERKKIQAESNFWRLEQNEEIRIGYSQH